MENCVEKLPLGVRKGETAGPAKNAGVGQVSSITRLVFRGLRQEGHNCLVLPDMLEWGEKGGPPAPSFAQR